MNFFYYILSLALLLLFGCSENTTKQAPNLATKRAERIANAEKIIGITPTPRSYQFNGGELRVLEVPIKDSLGFVETQRCYIWRDIEFKTSTLSCPSGATESPIPNLPTVN